MNTPQFIDLSILHEFSDGDSEEERRFIALFTKQAAESLSTLKDNCTNGENTLWIETAHQLKGTASLIGAHKLSALAGTAQNMKVSTQAQKISALKEIESAYNDVYEELKLLGLL